MPKVIKATILTTLHGDKTKVNINLGKLGWSIKIYDKKKLNMSGTHRKDKIKQVSLKIRGNKIQYTHINLDLKNTKSHQRYNPKRNFTRAKQKQTWISEKLGNELKSGVLWISNHLKITRHDRSSQKELEEGKKPTMPDPRDIASNRSRPLSRKMIPRRRFSW